VSPSAGDPAYDVVSLTPEGRKQARDVLAGREIVDVGIRQRIPQRGPPAALQEIDQEIEVYGPSM
jgi:hypothetical protein